MKNLMVKLVVTSGCLLTAVQSYAGGCRLKEVTPSKVSASLYMAGQIRDKVIAIEKQMEAKGEHLNAVLIGRMGESLNGFDVIKDDPNKTLQDYMDYLAKIAKANQQGRLQDAKGNPLPASNRAEVPDELLEKEKLKYSHFGILIKHNKVDPKAADWVYVIHLLSECDDDTNRYGDSSIFFQTFDQFFWDTQMLKKENNQALIVVPKPEIEERLWRLLHDAKIGDEGLHQPNYNVAAVPFVLRDPRHMNKPVPDYHQLKDQNSDQWPLEMLAAASQPYGVISNRTQAQDYLHQTNFHPSLVVPRGLKESMACSLRKGPFKLWDASNLLSCKDQVYRSVNVVQLITVESVVNYLDRNNMLAENVDDPSKPGVYEVVINKDNLQEIQDKYKPFDEAFEKAQKEKKKQKH